MKNLPHIFAFSLIALLASQSGQAQSDLYQLGMGLKVKDGFTLGGYFSSEFVLGDDFNEFVLDDVAIMAYGAFDNNFSYMVELESIEALNVDFENDNTSSNFPPTIERLYGDYKFSDNLSIRVGKQITPIGYWNLQPINVLRETTSNPKYSREMFPKFLTGVDLYGFTSFDDNLTYHLYLQGTGDMDKDNINIEVDSHVGFSLEKKLSSNVSVGGSFGRFTEKNDRRTNYLQLNARLDTARYSLISEAVVDDQDSRLFGSVKSKSAYLQGEYRFNSNHALIARGEYLSNGVFTNEDRIGVIGYSYRPVFPVSLKIEYQWHTDSRDNGLFSSISVLF